MKRLEVLSYLDPQSQADFKEQHPKFQDCSSQTFTAQVLAFVSERYESGLLTPANKMDPLQFIEMLHGYFSAIR